MRNRTKQLMALFMTASLCTGNAVLSVKENVTVYASEEISEQSMEESYTSDSNSDKAVETAPTQEDHDNDENKITDTSEDSGSEAEESEAENNSSLEPSGQDHSEETDAGLMEGCTEEASETETSESQSEDSAEKQTDMETTEKTGTEDTSADENKETDSDDTQKKKENLVITDLSGEALPMEEITGPQNLTVDSETYPVDYMQGVYRIYVPEGMETIQITVPDQGSEEQISMTRWDGWLMHRDENWMLYPNEASAKDFTQTENIYTVNLGTYALDLDQITNEQMAVYGSLEANLDYAEVFVYGEDRSVLLLIEYVPDFTQVSVLSASSSEINKTYTAAGNNLAQSASKYIPTVASINGEWQILGLARSDIEVSQSVYDQYIKNVIQTLNENDGVLHKKKYTEYSRVILALTSLGYDVTNVGGYNLLLPLADYDQTVWQGVNGAIFALIAFDSHDYEIPTVENGKTQNSREKLIENILGQEISGGGWALSGNTADSDMTAMAIQSLAPYYETDTKVKSAVDRGLSKLSAIQKSDGSYATYGSKTSESCAQVVVALTSLGINPNTDSRFIKNGTSVLEALMEFQMSDGSFRHVMSGGSDQMATEQAYYALTAYQRFVNGQTSLYDMTDIVLPSDKQKAAAVEALIQALPDSVTLADKDQIELTWNKYSALNKTQKNLISEKSVKKLQNAVDALKNLDSTWTETKKDDNTTQNTNKNDNKKENTGTTASSGNKVVSGTTKQVNLVSGSTKSTGKSAKSDSKTDADKIEDEEESGESSTDKESSEDEDAKVKSLESKLKKLFGTSTKLPDDPKDYTEEQLQSVLEIYKSFMKLSEIQQKEVEQGQYYRKYTKILEKLSTENHYDEESGTDLRDNEEEILPWYIRLEVETLDVEQENAEAVRDALDGQGELLSMNNIQLKDLMEDENWQPEDLLRVSIPLTELGEYEEAAVMHLKDDGSMEFLNAYIAGENLEFDTDHFSRFGIVGYNGTMADLMQKEQSENMWICLVPGVGALCLLVMLLFRKKKNRILKDKDVK